MLTAFEAQNFRCLKDVKVALTPLHAFIGPNDSGKSTLLLGIRTVVDHASFRSWGSKPEDPEGVSGGEKAVLRAWAESGLYALHLERSRLQERAQCGVSSTELGPFDDAPKNNFRHLDAFKRLVDEFSGSRYVRLDPTALREPSALIPDGRPIRFTDERGGGLPGVYDALLNRGDDTFRAINAEVCSFFPAVARIRLYTPSSNTKALGAVLRDGSEVPAEQLSDGLLYYLAYAALTHLEGVGLLLVEEPENGLHPSRIADVIRILRAISEKGTAQVILATHSPLVINELAPDEVTVVTRDPMKGTQIHPIAETPDFAERSKVYALGELWLSYADGQQEQALLEGVSAVAEDD